MDKKVGVFICALKWKPDYSEKPGNLGCEWNKDDFKYI